MVTSTTTVTNMKKPENYHTLFLKWVSVLSFQSLAQVVAREATSISTPHTTVLKCNSYATTKNFSDLSFSDALIM